MGTFFLIAAYVLGLALTTACFAIIAAQDKSVYPRYPLIVVTVLFWPVSWVVVLIIAVIDHARS